MENENVVTSASTEAGSLESWLRGRRAQVQEEQEHDLVVPGFVGAELHGVYRSPAYKQIRQIAERHKTLKPAEREVLFSADVLILCCKRLYAVGENGEQHDFPVWGIPFAEACGFTAADGIDSNRKAVLAVFQNRDIQLVQHSNELLEASDTTDAKADEDLAGE